MPEEEARGHQDSAEESKGQRNLVGCTGIGVLGVRPQLTET